MNSVDNVIYDHIMIENERLKSELKIIKESSMQKQDDDPECINLSDDASKKLEQYTSMNLGSKTYCLQPCFIEDVEILEEDMAKVTLTVYLELQK